MPAYSRLILFEEGNFPGLAICCFICPSQNAFFLFRGTCNMLWFPFSKKGLHTLAVGTCTNKCTLKTDYVLSYSKHVVI